MEPYGTQFLSTKFIIGKVTPQLSLKLNLKELVLKIQALFQMSVDMVFILVSILIGLKVYKDGSTELASNSTEWVHILSDYAQLSIFPSEKPLSLEIHC